MTITGTDSHGPGPSAGPDTVDHLLREATKARGYLEGYDDAVNDILRWLKANAPEHVWRQLAVAIETNSRNSGQPIRIQPEFLAEAK